MRNYLYLWHSPRQKRLVASGIEFQDLVPDIFPQRGVLLLRHNFADASRDPTTRLDLVPPRELVQLVNDDIYGYGDFCWTDFPQRVNVAGLSDRAISELTFFAQMARPLRSVAIPGLHNRLLCSSHDDGWHARIFYKDWKTIGKTLHRFLLGLLDRELARQTLHEVRGGKHAFWCHENAVIPCEQTEDIDALQQKYLAADRPGSRTSNVRKNAATS